MHLASLAFVAFASNQILQLLRLIMVLTLHCNDMERRKKRTTCSKEKEKRGHRQQS
jgi:hypothetical protein